MQYLYLQEAVQTNEEHYACSKVKYIYFLSLAGCISCFIFTSWQFFSIFFELSYFFPCNEAIQYPKEMQYILVNLGGFSYQRKSSLSKSKYLIYLFIFLLESQFMVMVMVMRPAILSIIDVSNMRLPPYFKRMSADQNKGQWRNEVRV